MGKFPWCFITTDFGKFLWRDIITDLGKFPWRQIITELGMLKQGYRYHKLPNFFSKFYRRYYDSISKSKLDLNLSCTKDFRNLNSVVPWCIN